MADLKTMDGGYLEAEMMAQAGASLVVVMGVAHPATIRACVRAARAYGIQVMGDIMAAPDKVACARMLEANGVDYIIVHTGFDERQRRPASAPWTTCPPLLLPSAYPGAGGRRPDRRANAAPARAARPLVVVGAPLAISDTAFAAGGPDAQLEQNIAAGV